MAGEAPEPWCSLSRYVKAYSMRLRLGSWSLACEARDTRASPHGAAELVTSGQSSGLVRGGELSLVVGYEPAPR